MTIQLQKTIAEPGRIKPAAPDLEVEKPDLNYVLAENLGRRPYLVAATASAGTNHVGARLKSTSTIADEIRRLGVNPLVTEDANTTTATTKTPRVIGHENDIVQLIETTIAGTTPSIGRTEVDAGTHHHLDAPATTAWKRAPSSPYWTNGSHADRKSQVSKVHIAGEVEVEAASIIQEVVVASTMLILTALHPQ